MLRPITGGAADAAPDSPAPDSFTPSTSRDLIGRRVTVRTVSDPALSGEPAPSEHTHPAMVRAVTDTGRIAWSPADAPWITATAPAEDVWFESVSAADVLRGRGFIPLIGDAR